MIRRTPLFLSLILGLGIGATGCGKKAGNKSNQGETTTPQITPTEIERLLERQEVVCDPNSACPNYLAKIVVINKGKLEYCTGFLVDEETVATSSSCLPDIIKGNGLDCSKDAFFFFPQTAYRPAERVKCEKVLQVSHIDRTISPALWRDDVAFLKLEKSLDYRRQAGLSRDGISNNKEYNVWFIDQVDEVTGLVRRESCEALHNTYVNPLSANESSPNLVFANCGLKKGNTGAPILDSRGRVRAMVSQTMSAKLREYLASTGLLTKPLKEMFHGTNFACAPTIYDSNVLDERECAKDLTYKVLDDLRSNMLSPKTLFSDMRKKLEESLVNTSRYIQFGVKLTGQGDVRGTEVFPRCFKPLNDWISSLNGTRNNYVFEVSVPVTTFKKVMDANGRVQGQILSETPKDHYMQFSLKSLRSNKRSLVYMWTNEENSTRTYQNLSEQCSLTEQLSLF